MTRDELKARNAEFVRRRQNGEPAKSIAADFGVSPQMVRIVLRRCGFCHGNGLRRPPRDPSRRADFMAARAAGETYHSIAERYGVHVTTVWRDVNRDKTRPRSIALVQEEGLLAPRGPTVVSHPAELVETARYLWGLGMSMSKCAMALGISRNAVSGIAHRNDFPARLSPIRRGA